MNRELVEKLMASLRLTSRAARNLPMDNSQSFSDWRMLRMLSHHYPDGATPSRLAAHMGISLPTVSQKLSVLEKQEFITRTPSKTDRRVTFVSITPQGQEKVKENYDVFVESFGKATQQLGEEKTLQLYNLLEEFRDCIENQTKGEENQ